MPDNFKVIRMGQIIPNKKKEKPLIMDEEDLVAHKQSVINDLAAAIRNHKQECPDHDVRVVDQKLWSWLDNYEFLNAKT